ncbi:MAG: urea transporter [Pirellulales bacterium]
MNHSVKTIVEPASPAPVAYWRLVLRGCAQLCFQSNELTGLCFLVAVLVASPVAFAYLLVAAALAPGGRMLLGERGPALDSGLPGLNPCLIALALPAFFHAGWNDIGMWGVLLLAVASTVVLTRVADVLLPFPTLAFPYVVTFWGLYALAAWLSVLQPIALGPTPPESLHPVEAVLLGLGQALFSPAIGSGMLFFVGVLISNWRHALLALCGAVIGTVMSCYHGGVTGFGDVDQGLYGFNGVLTAVSVFLFCGGKLRLSILGAVIATMLMPAFAYLGLPALSAPFVLTTWLMLALGWLEDHWFDVSASRGLPTAAALQRDPAPRSPHPSS